MDESHHLGSVLLKMLADRGVTKAQFARDCKMSRQWVQEICGRSNWHTTTLMRVCRTLDVSPLELLPKP